MYNLFSPDVDLIQGLENSKHFSLWDIIAWFNNVGFWVLLAILVLIGIVAIAVIIWFRRRR